MKHFIIGDSILYGTDDLTDWPWEEWRHCPDTTVVRASGLYLATIREDGTVAQEELLRTPVKGVIRDPAVSPDATRVAFSMRRTMDGDNYHLYVLDLKSRQLKQITFDGAYDDKTFPASDIEPCWLRDGSLVFQSTRCGQMLDCWPLPNTNLFRCEADGSRIRRLGFDEVSTFYPQLLDDDYEAWTYSPSNAVYGTTRYPTKRVRWQGKADVDIDAWPYGRAAAAVVRNLPGVSYLAGASRSIVSKLCPGLCRRALIVL